jgi:hypothetical protein
MLELNFTSHSREIGLYIGLFLSPMLHSLKIGDWPRVLPEGHGVITRTAPYLKSLTLTCKNPSASFREVVKDLEHLEVLIAPEATFDEDTLRSLALRQNLRHLHIWISAEITELALKPQSFPALERLAITGTADLCTEILNSVTSERLTSLEVRDALGVKSFHNYAVIAEKKWSQSLVDVSLEAVDVRTVSPIQLSALQPLLRCQKIETIRVLGKHPSSLGSDSRIISDFTWPRSKSEPPAT